MTVQLPAFDGRSWGGKQRTRSLLQEVDPAHHDATLIAETKYRLFPRHGMTLTDMNLRSACLHARWLCVVCLRFILHTHCYLHYTLTDRPRMRRALACPTDCLLLLHVPSLWSKPS